MTWRDVFDTKQPGTNITDSAKRAEEAGYRFFARNGKILFVFRDDKGELRFRDTGLTVKRELESSEVQ